MCSRQTSLSFRLPVAQDEPFFLFKRRRLLRCVSHSVFCMSTKSKTVTRIIDRNLTLIKLFKHSIFKAFIGFRFLSLVLPHSTLGTVWQYSRYCVAVLLGQKKLSFKHLFFCPLRIIICLIRTEKTVLEEVFYKCHKQLY